jgi:hypothetical protein
MNELAAIETRKIHDVLIGRFKEEWPNRSVVTWNPREDDAIDVYWRYRGDGDSDMQHTVFSNIGSLTVDKEPDMVSHPPHYQSETGMEVIDVIEAFTFDLKGIEATDTGNIIKYILRWPHKNGLEDLKKAQWYLNHLITHIEKLEKEND